MTRDTLRRRLDTLAAKVQSTRPLQPPALARDTRAIYQDWLRFCLGQLGRTPAEAEAEIAAMTPEDDAACWEMFTASLREYLTAHRAEIEAEASAAVARGYW